MISPDTALLCIGRVSALPAALLLDAERWLTQQEYRQYLGMNSPKRQRQFLAGRWWVRSSLALWAGGCWTDYHLSDSLAAGPRVLAGPAHTDLALCHCSLSHSGDWLACAIDSVAVGVDIEAWGGRPRDTVAMSDLVCAPSEREAVVSRTGQAQAEYFYALWTLKEAMLKQTSLCGKTMPDMSHIVFKPAISPSSTWSAVDARCAQHVDFTVAVYAARPCRLLEAHAVDMPVLLWQAWDRHCLSV